MEFAELSRSIAQRFPALSRELQRSARYLVDHPDDVALLSMRRVAASAGVQPATLLRLARRLDFDGYPALRQVFVERLRRRTTSYSRRALELQGRGSGDRAETAVRETIAGHLRNLQASLDRNGVDRFLACAAALEGARTLYVLGLRSCFPLAFFFHYVHRLFRDNGVLLDGRGGTFPDDLRGIGTRDVLLAISLAPYTRDTVRAVEFAVGRGATIVALTDSPVSPLARLARHTLLFTTDTPSFFHSVTAAMSIVEALLALLVARGGDRAVAAISASEAQLASFAAYWRERAPKRPARRTRRRRTG
ncbi:MAG TPA: MurR/RpiR family transcriptional regulator [Thermodesulfobacteriota bacterium]